MPLAQAATDRRSGRLTGSPARLRHWIRLDVTAGELGWGRGGARNVEFDAPHAGEKARERVEGRIYAHRPRGERRPAASCRAGSTRQGGL